MSESDKQPIVLVKINKIYLLLASEEIKKFAKYEIMVELTKSTVTAY